MRCLFHPPAEEGVGGRATVTPLAQGRHAGTEEEDQLVALGVIAAAHEAGGADRDGHIEDERPRQPSVVVLVRVLCLGQPHVRSRVLQHAWAADHVSGHQLVHMRRRRRLALVSAVVGAHAHIEAGTVASGGPPLVGRRGCVDAGGAQLAGQRPHVGGGAGGGGRGGCCCCELGGRGSRRGASASPGCWCCVRVNPWCGCCVKVSPGC